MRNVAVAAMTKNIADELGPHGINVTVVHPGLTRTEATRRRRRPDGRRPGHHRGGGRAHPRRATRSGASSRPTRSPTSWRSSPRHAASPSPATPSPAAAASPARSTTEVRCASRRAPASRSGCKSPERTGGRILRAQIAIRARPGGSADPRAARRRPVQTPPPPELFNPRGRHGSDRHRPPTDGGRGPPTRAHVGRRASGGDDGAGEALDDGDDVVLGAALGGQRLGQVVRQGEDRLGADARLVDARTRRPRCPRRSPARRSCASRS